MRCCKEIAAPVERINRNSECDAARRFVISAREVQLERMRGECLGCKAGPVSWRDSMDRRRRAYELIACFFFVLLASRIVAAQERSLDTDRAGLERFKLAVDPTGTLLPWVSGTNPCTWTGIQCYQNRVAVLRLSRYNFSGVLPANTLSELDQLRIVSLHHNKFTGPFPIDLTQCTILHGLFLANNLFSGALPDFTALWPRLSHFDIAFNNFSGDIPESLNTLQNLLVLELQNNAFSGKIPPITQNLLRFSVANNELEGPVPLPLQAFPNSSFAGNLALCGPPTQNLCSPVSPPPISLTTPPAPMSTTQTASPSKMSVGAIAGVAIGAFVILIALTIFFLCCCCPRCGDNDDELHSHPNSHPNSNSNSNSLVGNKQVTPYDGEDFAFKAMTGLQFLDPGKRQEFALEELLQASAEVLGKGSMGTSYKAEMAECVVVVKRLKEIVAGRREFETQVARIGRVRHRHLLPVRAFFFSRDEKLLVTDFMSRGSLFGCLHGEQRDDRPVLDWVSRERIALGSARALAYLHKPSVKMAHGNITSCNILLNCDYEPFLTDYGLTSLLNPVSFTTSRFVGYRAPEVSNIHQVSLQSDVYSFGVVLLELITGQAPRSKENSDKGVVDLPRWIASIPREDWSAKAFDPELLKEKGTSSSCAEEEMAQMLQLGVACVDRIAERRPKMDELVLLLEDITQSKPSEALPSRSGGPTPMYTRPSSGVFVVE